MILHGYFYHHHSCYLWILLGVEDAFIQQIFIVDQTCATVWARYRVALIVLERKSLMKVSSVIKSKVLFPPVPAPQASGS